MAIILKCSSYWQLEYDTFLFESVDEGSRILNLLMLLMLWLWPRLYDVAMRVGRGQFPEIIQFSDPCAAFNDSDNDNKQMTPPNRPGGIKITTPLSFSLQIKELDDVLH